MPAKSAALTGFYSTSEASGRSRKVTNHKYLSNSDMKQLARVLRGVPFPYNPEADKNYRCKLKQHINDLPWHLRSTGLGITYTENKETGKVKPGRLCSAHEGLGSRLIYSIWDWVKYQLENRVGQYMYPVIMHGGLTKHQELKARQLEPVLQMYRTDFTVAGSAPPDHEPITPGYLSGRAVWVPKFSYQVNECPACILARIGSDTDVLSALMSGVVAHMSSGHIGHRDDIRSVRVRFIKYWLKVNKGGEKMVDQAWELGKEIRRMRQEWKVGCNPQGTSNVRESVVPVDISEMYDPAYRPANPTPRAAGLESVVDKDTSEPFISAPELAMPRAPTLAEDNPMESAIGIDISEPFISPSPNTGADLLAPSHAATQGASSIHNRTQHNHTLHNGLKQTGAVRRPTVPTPHDSMPPTTYVQQEHANAKPSHVPSVHSRTSRYSVLSSINSFDHLPLYDSRHTTAHTSAEGADICPRPLRITNTSREQAREDMALARPNLASTYGGFGNPFYEDDMYGDVSPPGRPNTDDGAGQAYVDGAYELSPPSTLTIDLQMDFQTDGKYDGSPLDLSSSMLDTQTTMTKWSAPY